ncbi:hypothetical protein GCM10007417_25590 [Glycocaulis alkaliphilus]|nr:hypothetical protein GCM10007417_25590 [Glycocaulis alkaliphilus]
MILTIGQQVGGLGQIVRSGYAGERFVIKLALQQDHRRRIAGVRRVTITKGVQLGKGQAGHGRDMTARCAFSGTGASA